MQPQASPNFASSGQLIQQNGQMTQVQPGQHALPSPNGPQIVNLANFVISGTDCTLQPAMVLGPHVTPLESSNGMLNQTPMHNQRGHQQGLNQNHLQQNQMQRHQGPQQMQGMTNLQQSIVQPHMTPLDVNGNQMNQLQPLKAQNFQNTMDVNAQQTQAFHQSVPTPSNGINNGCKIFVGWLPEATQDYQVMSFMALFGDVTGLKVMGKDQGKPCCIVQFSNQEQATNAIAYLNNLYLPGNANPLQAKTARN